MEDIKGLATGIGSLPYKDIDEALDLIFKYTPRIPFWPQLPKRDKRESMVAQYSEGLPCLKFGKQGLVFVPSGQDDELSRFYEHIIGNDWDYFKISPNFAAGLWGFIRRLEKQDLSRVRFIKGQLTGPFTFAASINDKQGKAILHNKIFTQAVWEGLAMKAIWQINLLKQFGKPIILFLDEPYLACFGSAFTPINREDVVAGLSDFTKKIKSPDVMLGVHCCGNTDWSIFTEVPGIDVINFDAFSFLERVLLYAGELIGFLNRSGLLAWGIVPSEGFSSGVSAAGLSDKLNQGLNRLIDKGIGEDLVRNRLILTPACGLGSLSQDRAEPIFKTLAELSSYL